MVVWAAFNSTYVIRRIGSYSCLIFSDKGIDTKVRERVIEVVRLRCGTLAAQRIFAVTVAGRLRLGAGQDDPDRSSIRVNTLNSIRASLFPGSP